MQPTKGISFFSFEENIDHVINQAKVMTSTGVTGTFFENPYGHPELIISVAGGLGAKVGGGRIGLWRTSHVACMLGIGTPIQFADLP